MPIFNLTLPRSLALVAAIAATCASADAGIVSSAPDPFPPGSGLSSGGTTRCAPLGCITNGVLSNFQVDSDSFAANESLVLSTVFHGSLYDSTDSVLLANLALTGSVDVTIFGRTSAGETGTWGYQITSVDLTGTALGHSLAMTLDPANPSLGEVTIAQLTSVNGNPLYSIDNTVDLYPELSVDGGAPTQFGEITASLEMPEPATMTTLMLPLAAMALARRRQAGQASRRHVQTR